MAKCQFCGEKHEQLCQRIRVIEYDQGRDLREGDQAGPLWMVKRIEFHGAPRRGSSLFEQTFGRKG